MNAHALAVLEFDRVLHLVADRAASAPGAARVRTLRPSADIVWCEREHARVAAMRALCEGERPWRPEPIPDLASAIRRLRIAGSLWQGKELLDGALLLRSSRITREALRDPERSAAARAVLAEFAGSLMEDRAAEERIGRAIDHDGTVKDDASPSLRRIRRELRGAEAELIRLLERIMRSLDASQVAPDLSITMRNGRYVIPVRRDGRSDLGGIVHDTSGSGGTIFVEPPAAVAFGNRIRELEAEEGDEVERILAELTDGIRPLQEGLDAALDALIALDALYARARFAIEFHCATITLCQPAEGLEVYEARHPLLLARGLEVTPLNLVLDPAERTLLVSGPNTGGKTVLLKAVGLFAAMAQAGIPPTVGAGSRLAVFDDCFADVGDEQSIEASLSTFSAHLKNLREILLSATANSLVLTDELGSGTDPLEGAALGAAILEDLTRRGTRTVATTHLGALKQLALEEPGVVNGSLRFDAERMQPTYQFIKGVPGRSYGVSIARRLGLPEHVIAAAELRVPTAERDAMVLLADLEARADRLERAEREARTLTERAAEREGQLVERERLLKAREKEVEREARKDARRYLLEARTEVERVVRELKGAESAALADAAKAARRSVEELATAQGKALNRLEQPDGVAAAPARSGGASTAGDVAAGDLVEVETLGGKLGRVVERRGNEAVVTVGSVKMTLPVRTLRKTTKELPKEKAVALDREYPEDRVSPEVDLRGLRVHELDDTLVQAIDSAVRADLKSLRIIHGKGTGALRERVSELLKTDPRVKDFRLGLWNEGGAGVTIADVG